jgi:excisionase family DNA binding protein
MRRKNVDITKETLERIEEKLNTAQPAETFLTVEEACQRLGGLSRSRFYAIRGAGAIKCFKPGKRLLVSVTDLNAYIQRAPAPVRKSAAAEAEEYLSKRRAA